MCNIILINSLLYFLEKVWDIWFSKEIDSFVRSIKSIKSINSIKNMENIENKENKENIDRKNKKKIEEIKKVYNTMEEGNNMKVIGLFVAAYYNKELYNLLQEANPNPYPNPLTNQKFTKEMWEYLFNIDYPNQITETSHLIEIRSQYLEPEPESERESTIAYENIRKEVLELFQHIIENKINIIGMTAQEYCDRINNPI